MAIYALDALLLLMVKDILSVGFHAYALYAIYRGFSAITQMQSANAAHAMSGAAIEPQ
jgi:hypothetical protein